jgi:tryptophan synthase alpha chain
MTTPLSDLFAKTRSEGRAALIGYIPAGFPSKEGCIEVVKAMVAGGVDAVEIGYPYSDPVMDGPIIQAAADTSLRAGTGAEDVFAVLGETSALGVPAVVMTYWNPIEKYGVDRFAAAIAEHGGSGVITPDLTFEESKSWIGASDAQGINRIYVVAPSTTASRLGQVTELCSGFVYAASLMGVTGTRQSVSGDAQGLVSRIRETTQIPVAVGLGVSNKEQAAEVAGYADGVIVGSAFIRLIQEAETFASGLAAVEALAASLSEGVRRK